MANAGSPHALSELIGSIYDCVLDPSRWEQTLADIMGALSCRTATLGLLDVRHDRFLINKSVGIEPHIQQQVAKHIPELNALMVQTLATWGSLDEPYMVSRHVPRTYVETSPYFQECVTPYGIVDILQYFLMHTPTRFAVLGFARHEEQGVITEREIELGGLLLPHIRRAVTISNVLDIRTIERARMAEALDSLRCAVVLTDGRGTILHANRSAEHMLRNDGPIRADRGILRANAPAAAKELRDAIRFAARDETRIGKSGLSIVLSESDIPPIFAHVLPMCGGDLRTRLQPEAVAAVFIGATPDEQDAADLIATAFGLTPAETRVLANLLAGRTLAETTAALGVAASTTKTHLDHIFGKTGVTRQAALMRLAAGLIPPTKYRD
jgi:DNA-binding CsgD family transcriptional regulator